MISELYYNILFQLSSDKVQNYTFMLLLESLDKYHRKNKTNTKFIKLGQKKLGHVDEQIHDPRFSFRTKRPPSKLSCGFDTVSKIK